MVRKISIALTVMLWIAAANAPYAFSLQRDSSLVPQAERACSLVQRELDSGVGVRSVVKTSIQMGYDACTVVKCALNSGGNPKEVIGGAVDAGAPSDVIARCSLDAGTDVSEVLADLRNAGTSACYVEPLGYSEPPSVPLGPPEPPPPSPPPISTYIP
jgi:hypothetical protein